MSGHGLNSFHMSGDRVPLLTARLHRLEIRLDVNAFGMQVPFPIEQFKIETLTDLRHPD